MAVETFVLSVFVITNLQGCLCEERPLPVLVSSSSLRNYNLKDNYGYSRSTVSGVDLSDPEVKKGLASNYVKEAFFNHGYVFTSKLVKVELVL